jgi:DNA polymerase III delta prime subunit
MTDKVDKVLSVSLRPSGLDEIVGQDEIVKAIKTQFKSGRIPHFFLITGPTGSGKCLGFNTPVLMFNGTTKMVQDIVQGDKLMGDDMTLRNVLSVSRGQEKMYKVFQNHGIEYVVNESHILSLIMMKDKEDNRNGDIMDRNGHMYKTGDIVDISVRDYNNLNSNQKRCLRGYRVPIIFEAKNMNILLTNIEVTEVDQDYYEQGPEYLYYYGFEIDGNRRFLLGDNTVTHNTTLARIIAVMLQHENPLDPENEDLPISKYDIKEINASDKNGVDDVRELLETIRYKPHLPSLAKVYILDEAHQLTTPAQNAFLKDTEDAPSHVYFIFCTSNGSKIIPTLKRRAYTLTTHGIDQDSIHKLLLNAKKKTGFKGELKELMDALIDHEVDTPGLILQAAEKYFSGVDPMNCIFGSGSEGSIDTKKLCQTLLKGDWKSASPILKTMTKDDVVMVRNCVLGYFKAVLFNTGSVKLAQAMKIIAEECFDLPTFLANLCIACGVLKEKS